MMQTRYKCVANMVNAVFASLLHRGCKCVSKYGIYHVCHTFAPRLHHICSWVNVSKSNLICYKTDFNVDVKRATPLFNSFGSNSKGKKVSANRVLITWLICLILTFYPCVRVVYICWCVPTWCAETSYITRAILLQIAKGCHFLV